MKTNYNVLNVSNFALFVYNYRKRKNNKLK